MIHNLMLLLFSDIVERTHEAVGSDREYSDDNNIIMLLLFSEYCLENP